MKKILPIRIGHLKIVGHLILGYSVFRFQSNSQGSSGLENAIRENIPMNSWEQISDGLKRLYRKFHIEKFIKTGFANKTYNIQMRCYQ